MKKLSSPLPVLAIGGLDPSGHAGLFADTRVFEDLGLPYRVAATAITAQSEKKFIAWKPVDLGLFRQQLEAAGIHFSGVKIGMLGTEAHARETLRWLKKTRPGWTVWDPVWRSSTGAKLFRAKGLGSLLALLSEVDAWTPNLPEAEIFLNRPIGNLSTAQAAVRDLWKMGKKKSRFVVLKGGHLSDVRESAWAIDLLDNGLKIIELKGKRFGISPRGTGCAFASALLVALVSGQSPLAASRFAKNYVRKTLFACHPERSEG